MNNSLLSVEKLVEIYKYKKLPNELSKIQRENYLQNLSPALNINGNLNCQIYYKGIHISNGYNRIVIGDYGAYVEIDPELMDRKNIKVKPGQEYRFSEKYSNIKYYWYCLKEAEEFKIYYQKNTVTYADYLPKMCYISPDNLTIIKN